MGDFIQTNSRRSFGREHSFSTWRQATESSQETSYVSDFQLGRSQQFQSSEFSETRSGSPRQMFKWSARESTMSSSRMMYGLGGNVASDPTITQPGDPPSPMMRRSTYVGGFGTPIRDEERYPTAQASRQNEPLLLTNTPDTPTSYQSPVLPNPDAPVGADSLLDSTVRALSVGSPVHANSVATPDIGTDAMFGSTVRTPRSYKHGGPLTGQTVSTPPRSPGPSRLSSEIVDSIGKKPMWDDEDRVGFEFDDSNLGTRSFHVSPPPGTSSLQLSPVIENADYDDKGGTSRHRGDQVSLDSKESAGPSRSVCSRECRENMYNLSQHPWGSSVSPSSRASGTFRAENWVGQSIDALDMTDAVSIPRVVRDKYKHKLRPPSKRMMRLGRLCAKSLWFWIGLVAIVAGIEGFIEEKGESSINQEGWWSDDEE